MFRKPSPQISKSSTKTYAYVSKQQCKFIFIYFPFLELHLTRLFFYTVSINGKPTQSTMPPLRFIAYTFHRTHLTRSVASRSCSLLPLLKLNYPAASCAP